MSLHTRLSAWMNQAAQGKPGVIVGLSGPQGSGKSTLSATVARTLIEQGLRVAVLSLDDLYLSRGMRRQLADHVHPLLAVRGPPGTHDVALGIEVLDALARPGPVVMPRFDKARDDGVPGEAVTGPFDLILFEGWCVGALPQDDAALVDPINALEREADADGRWRRYVNAQLAGAYQDLFGRMDHLVMLEPPGFEVVAGWRQQQEHELRARVGDAAPGVMSDAEVARFIQHYERITRALIIDAPRRADVLIRLDPDRRPVLVRGLA